MSGLLTSFLVISTAIAQTQPAPSGTAAERQERLQYMKTKGAELAFFRAENVDTPLTMTAEPVLRYSNPLGLGQTGDGVTLLWLAGTRPLAAVSFSIRPPRDDVYMECTSFSAQPLVCRRQETPIWSPKAGGLIAQRLDREGLRQSHGAEFRVRMAMVVHIKSKPLSGFAFQDRIRLSGCPHPRSPDFLLKDLIGLDLV